MLKKVMLFTLVLGSVPSYAKVTITPKLDLTLLHVVDAAFSQDNYEGHEAANLMPSLTISRKGNIWQSTLNAEHNYIKQIESGIADTKTTNLSLQNQFSFLNNRIVLTNSISRQNRNIDSSLGGASDPIFGQSEYIDFDTINTQLTIRNSRRSNWRNVLSVGTSSSSFDESELEETDATVTSLSKGQRHTASLSLGYGQRPSQIRGGLQFSFARNDRSNRGEQDTINAAVSIGVPIWSDIDFVVQGNKSKNLIANSLLDDTALQSESYGAGLAWRLGTRSNFEVTYNLETRAEEDKFIGYKLEMFPSSKTFLSYEQSQRFYGKSHALRLSHTARRWNVSLNYNESLGYQTRINRETVSLGDFLCPEEFNEIEECTKIDERPEEIEDGFLIGSFSESVFNLVEEVVLSKSASASLGYNFKKAKISVSYSESESEYLERPEVGVRESTSKSISYSHTMTRRNSFSISATQSQSISGISLGGSRDSYRLNTSFIRKLSRKSVGKISLVKYSSEATNGNLNRQDTRVEVNYSYSF